MKKILILLLLLSMSSCELLQLKSQQTSLNCASFDGLHPKNQAICVLRKEMDLLRNKKIHFIVSSYKKKGLRISENYKVSLISGGGDGESLSWTYLVSVDFNNLKKYQSIIGLVEVYASKPPRIVKVLSGDELQL